MYNRAYLENWTNWQEYLEAKHPDKEIVFENYIEAMIEEYKEFTPEFAEKESGVKAEMIREIAVKLVKPESDLRAITGEVQELLISEDGPLPDVFIFLLC